MQQDVVIHSGREDFVLLERIVEVGPSHIVAHAAFQEAPLYAGLEALAQLGAYHVRYLTDYAQHAFLLKITDCPLRFAGLNGRFLLRGSLTGRSASSFAYEITIEEADSLVMKGRFLFAAADYNERFKKELLEKHYRKVFACLQDDTKTGC